MGANHITKRGYLKNVSGQTVSRKLKRAIVVAFHRYTPFGKEFYEPLLDFFILKMKEYHAEYDMVYFIDSTWDIDPTKLEGLKAKIIKVSPHLRYYDAYKAVLPEIKESLVLFVDNDTVIYREGVIDETFRKLEGEYDVVSIYDTIGEKTFKKLGGKSKFCPYWFATGTVMLRDYTQYDWGSNMPKYETLGKLTERMLIEEVKPCEWPEDKNSIYFDGTQDEEHSKDTGVYHIRAGSTPAYLLATYKYGDIETYNSYINNQPQREYIRQMAWYDYMCKESSTPDDRRGMGCSNALLVVICNILGHHGNNECTKTDVAWEGYMEKFRRYHNLRYHNLWKNLSLNS